MKIVYATNNEDALEFIKSWEPHFKSYFGGVVDKIVCIDNDPEDLNVTFKFMYEDLEVKLTYISGCGLWRFVIDHTRWSDIKINIPLMNDSSVLEIVWLTLEHLDY